MTTIQPGSAGPPPGWYNDPNSEAERYWNGLRWTEHTRGAPGPAPTPAAPERASNGYVTAGYVFAVLLPIVGLIMGIVMMTKNRGNDGAGCIVLSLLMGVFFVGILH